MSQGGQGGVLGRIWLVSTIRELSGNQGKKRGTFIQTIPPLVSWLLQIPMKLGFGDLHIVTPPAHSIMQVPNAAPTPMHASTQFARAILLTTAQLRWFSYGFPLVSYGFPMVFLWFLYDLPMVFPWFPWFFYGFPMVFL